MDGTREMGIYNKDAEIPREDVRLRKIFLYYLSPSLNIR